MEGRECVEVVDREGHFHGCTDESERLGSYSDREPLERV